MANQKQVLEWQVLLSDAEWDRRESLDELLGEQAAGAAGQKRRVLHAWTAALAALLVIGASAWMLYREAEAGLAEIEGELTSAVEAEVWHEQAQREAASAAGWQRLYAGQNKIVPSPVLSETVESGMSGTEIGATTTAETGKVSLRTGLAMVEVTTTDALGHAYRETQFYSEAYQPNGLSEWQRTSPQESFWGAARHIESDYFDFHYRRLDADAVEEVAARLDAIYAQLRADVGLPVSQERLEITVLPELPSEVVSLHFEEGRLTVASPELLRVPVEMSDGAALLKSITHPLVGHVASEAIREDRVRREWSALVRGLQLWQIYVGSGAAEPDLQERWFWEVIAWLDEEVMEIQRGARKASVEDVYLLCREFYGWRHTLPRVISVPILCMSEQWEAAIPYHMTHTPEQLDRLLYRGDWETASYVSWYEEWVQGVYAATVIDYAVETYGRDVLPALVEGFHTHRGWETLVPEVFGVSMEEFEAGWSAFRQERGLSVAGE